MGVTAELSAFSARVGIDTLPAEVAARTRLLVLDLIGNMVRGRHGPESTPPLLAAVQALGLDSGSSRVFGDPASYSPAGAALLNGTCAHSLDFDDTHAAGTLHPGAPVIPAALAAAEVSGASGAEVLAAIVAGYEVTCRTALALPAGDHYQRGFHPTATCGVFGAAAAAGRVFGLDADQIASALGIALSQSGGSLQFLVNGAWTKRFQVGWAAMAGLAAASLAREGFKGAAQAMEGEHGFLSAYAPNPIPKRATEGLGQVFELMATGVKPYPSCRYGHAGVDAALAIRAEHGFAPDEIDQVTYGLSKAGMLLVGAPAEKKADPRNVVDAQFSGPFVISSALAYGAMDWAGYDRLGDPVIRALLPRVRCEFDPEIEAEFPANMSGKLTVRARGETVVRKVIAPKGEPGNFLTEAELSAKFLSLAAPVLGEDKARGLQALAMDLDRLGDIHGLMAAGAGT